VLALRRYFAILSGRFDLHQELERAPAKYRRVARNTHKVIMMSDIASIAVLLTGSAEDQLRLDYSEGLATRFNAHLTGMLVHRDPELLAVPDLVYADVLQQLVDEAEAATSARKEELRRKMSVMAIQNELRVISGWPSEIGRLMASEVRASDLFVCTRPVNQTNGDGRIEESVLFESGRPCILLPQGKPAPAEFKTILVAWKDSREAARALRDALPFLKLAAQVIVAVANEAAEEESGRSSWADIARFLSRHGVNAEIRELSGWQSASRALINEAKKSSADLLIAGAYGHWRWQERLWGGVTRSLLTECEKPLLMSR
jgi:nucleotide-binding universal stress UspA family protein